MCVQVIVAAGAVKHEDIVEQVKKLFTKLSSDPTTVSELVAKEPAVFTGSEVRLSVLMLWLSHLFPRHTTSVSIPVGYPSQFSLIRESASSLCTSIMHVPRGANQATTSQVSCKEWVSGPSTVFAIWFNIYGTFYFFNKKCYYSIFFLY